MQSKYKIKGFKGLPCFGMQLKILTGVVKTFGETDEPLSYKYQEPSKVVFFYDGLGSIKVRYMGICPECHTEYFNSFLHRNKTVTCFNGHKNVLSKLFLNPIEGGQ